MLDIIFTTEDATTPSSGILQLQGSATVPFCTELRTALLDALNQTESLTVDVSGITEVDVSALQLLCAARRSAIQKQQQMVLADKLSDAFSTAVLETGFKRSYSASCMNTAGQPCLWENCKPAKGELAP